MSNRRIDRFAALCGLLFLVVSCGGGDEEVAEAETVHKVQSSTTLQQKGTAESPEEAAAREAAAAAKRAANAAAMKTFEWQQKLDDAERRKDAFDIAEALTGIADLGADASAIEGKVEAFVTHSDRDVRIAALSCLVAIRGARARNELQKALRDEEDGVRVAALRLWRKAGIADSAPVVPLIDDFSGDVQYEAIAILKAKTPNAADLALLVEKSRNLEGPAARLALAYGIDGFDSLGGAPAVEKLVAEMLDHQDPVTRVAAVKGSSEKKITRPVVVKTLVKILDNDPELDVRKKAYEYLQHLAGPQAPAYNPEAEDEARSTAAAAWEAWFEANSALFK